MMRLFVLRASRFDAPTLTAVAVGAAAAAVRLPGAFHDALWQDEVASARILSEPSLPAMLHSVARTESAPPLWYTLGWLAHQAGLPIQDVRLLSVGFGALLASLVVVFARPLLPLPLAALAGGLVAVGEQFVAHGHELRAYELCALHVIVLALELEAEVRAPDRTREIALAVTVAAGALTHYFFFFTVAAGLAWLWLEPEARAVRRRATAAIAAGLVACMPWAPVILVQYRRDRFWWIGPFRSSVVIDTPLRLFAPVLRNGGAREVIAVVFVGIVGAGALWLARGSARGRTCAALGFGHSSWRWSHGKPGYESSRRGT
jgi:hypothetical protein